MANVLTGVARRAAAAPAASGRRPVSLLPRARRNAGAWAFLIGAVLCFSFFSWYPIVREVIMSFQKPVYGGGYTWAGWSNYIRIFHDPTFWQAWRNTLEFTVLALVTRVRGPVHRRDRAQRAAARARLPADPRLPAGDAAARVGAAAVRLLLQPAVRAVRRHPPLPAPAHVAVGVSSRAAASSASRCCPW